MMLSMKTMYDGQTPQMNSGPPAGLFMTILFMTVTTTASFMAVTAMTRSAQAAVQTFLTVVQVTITFRATTVEIHISLVSDTMWILSVLLPT